MELRSLAHVRSGDKGDIAQISVIAYQAADYEFLAEWLTVDRLARHFNLLQCRSIKRYELPSLGALNFVLSGAITGGVTRSLALDAHGKTLAMQLLNLEIPER
jgi:hypothetical protein